MSVPFTEQSSAKRPAALRPWRRPSRLLILPQARRARQTCCKRNGGSKVRTGADAKPAFSVSDSRQKSHLACCHPASRNKLPRSDARHSEVSLRSRRGEGHSRNKVPQSSLRRSRFVCFQAVKPDTTRPPSRLLELGLRPVTDLRGTKFLIKVARFSTHRNKRGGAMLRWGPPGAKTGAEGTDFVPEPPRCNNVRSSESGVIWNLDRS